MPKLQRGCPTVIDDHVLGGCHEDPPSEHQYLLSTL
jgi:hypothetical protein